MDSRLKITSDAQKHVQAYLEYVNLTGDTGDHPMSEKAYEEYKQTAKANAGNRLYVYWVSSQGLECKVIGPANKCFCDHRYKEHDFMDFKAKKIRCKAKGCACPMFNYIPIYGSQDFKCSCKHSYTDHNPSSKKCVKCKCPGFVCSWNCSCGEKYGSHATSFETRAERVKNGKRVDDVSDAMPMNIGGITNFSSLADGTDKFEYQVNQRINERAIGGRQQGMIMGESDGRVMGKGAIMKENEDNGQLTAFMLFNTPHVYANSGPGIKAIGYKRKY